MTDDDKQLPAGWKTEKTGEGGHAYSLTKFYCGSVDDKGHGTTYHVKFPDYSIPRLQSTAQACPEYKGSVQNLVRDAVRHRLEYLEKNYAAVSECPERRLYDALEMAEVMAAKTKTFESIPKKIRTACQGLQKARAWDLLSDYVISQRAEAIGYPQPWKRRILKVLDEFAGLTGKDDCDEDDDGDE